MGAAVGQSVRRLRSLALPQPPAFHQPSPGSSFSAAPGGGKTRESWRGRPARRGPPARGACRRRATQGTPRAPPRTQTATAARWPGGPDTPKRWLTGAGRRRRRRRKTGRTSSRRTAQTATTRAPGLSPDRRQTRPGTCPQSRRTGRPGPATRRRPAGGRQAAGWPRRPRVPAAAARPGRP